jgi:hypothetical protein
VAIEQCREIVVHVSCCTREARRLPGATVAALTDPGESMKCSKPSVRSGSSRIDDCVGFDGTAQYRHLATAVGDDEGLLVQPEQAVRQRPAPLTIDFEGKRSKVTPVPAAVGEIVSSSTRIRW